MAPESAPHESRQSTGRSTSSSTWSLWSLASIILCITTVEMAVLWIYGDSVTEIRYGFKLWSGSLIVHIHGNKKYRPPACYYDRKLRNQIFYYNGLMARIHIPVRAHPNFSDGVVDLHSSTDRPRDSK